MCHIKYYICMYSLVEQSIKPMYSVSESSQMYNFQYRLTSQQYYVSIPILSNFCRLVKTLSIGLLLLFLYSIPDIFFFILIFSFSFLLNFSLSMFICNVIVLENFLHLSFVNWGGKPFGLFLYLLCIATVICMMLITK